MWYEPKDRVLQFGRWSQYVDFVRRLSTDSDLYVSIMAAIRDIEQGPDGVEEIGGDD